MDRRWLLSRRVLLGGIGGAGLGSLLPRGSGAAPNAAPRRLIVVHVPEGMWSGAARPAVGASTLGPIMNPLDPYISQVLVVNNLNMASRDHGPGGDGHTRGVPHMLTCTEMLDADNAGGISLDQKVANAVGAGMPFKSLPFAVRIVFNNDNGHPLWSAPGQVVLAEQDPWSAYARIFANSVPKPPTPNAVDFRKSAIDSSLSEINALRLRLSVSDRARLDTYQASLRSIEQRLVMMQPVVGCTPPALGAKIDPQANANFPAIMKLQMDLIVASLQCGMTNVCTLQCANSNDQTVYDWLGITGSVGHDLAHNNGNCDPDNSKKLKVYNWYASQFAYLLGRLKAIPESGGTMLDNTLVLWASEFSNSNIHDSSRLMWLLMGNVGGYFKTGRVVDVAGRSCNDLHTTVCNAFGITDQTFGNPVYCQGPLPLT